MIIIIYRYPALYEGIDIQKFTQDLVTKLRKYVLISFSSIHHILIIYSFTHSLTHRPDLSQEVLCESFDLVLRVIHKSLLPQQSQQSQQSQQQETKLFVDWGLLFYSSIADILAHSPSSSQITRIALVYKSLANSLLVITDDSSVADAVCTVLPSFLTHVNDSVVRSVLSLLLPRLVGRSPAILQRWVQPYVVTVLDDLQQPGLEKQLEVLVELEKQHSTEVREIVKEAMVKVVREVVVTETGEVADCMMFRHVVCLLEIILRLFPYVIMITTSE